MKTVRRLAFLGLTALLAAPAAAQPSVDELRDRCERGGVAGGHHRHCDVRETRLTAGGPLAVDAGANGGVTVRAWEGREVVVRAVVVGWGASEGRARALAGEVRVQTDGTVRASGPTAQRSEGWTVNYDVLVPARTNLELEARNGPVTVVGVEGDLRLRATNGPIILDRVAGDVRARVQNGPITVTLDGSGWSGAGLTAESSNGPITVRMPREYAAHVVGSTRNGPIRTDLPVSRPRTGSVGGSVDAEVNGGGRTLRFTTVNGPLVINRR